MIVFETQEEFEDAVMAVIGKRLGIESRSYIDYGWGGELKNYQEISLKDTYSTFSSTSID